VLRLLEDTTEPVPSRLPSPQVWMAAFRREGFDSGRQGLTLRRSSGPTVWMLLCPRLDSRSFPNAPCRQLYLGRGEIGDRLNHPVDPLSGDAEHLRDLSDA
jgi:hypothetical protein